MTSFSAPWPRSPLVLPPRHARAWRWVATAAAALGTLAIVSTYRVFSQTVDEPAHIAAGMEWLTTGRYTYETQHPPLTRVAAAIGPYLAGERSTGARSMWTEGRHLLGVGPHYVRTLALARLGELPFFLLILGVVWAWGRRLMDERGAALSVIFAVADPNLLAHAGLATTDIGVAATMSAALLAFVYWMEWPGWRECVALGAALGLTAVSKFSGIAFLGLTLPLSYAARGLVRGRWRLAEADASRGTGVPLPALGAIGAVAITAALVVWTTYGFAVGRVPASPAWIVPAPGFFDGLIVFAVHGALGAPAFLLGQLSDTGWWYYFPVAILVKTPLPTLCFAAAGAVVAGRALCRREQWEPALPLIGIASVLAISMAAHVNIGIRLVLPVSPLLALLAAVGATTLWRAAKRRPVRRFAIAALGGVALFIPLRADPDFLAYFNPIAGRRPERVLVDSNLDWGQDLYRLADTLRARGIDSVRVAYFGSATLYAAGVPNARRLGIGERATGWVAASETFLAGEWVGPAFVWLKQYRPVARIGPSMRLYYVPASIVSPLRLR